MNVTIFESSSFEAEQSRVFGACYRLGLGCATFDGSEPVGDVAVAFLPAGERRVPPSVLQALATTGERTPLLVITRDRVTRPTEWLEDGTMVVMGGSPSEERIASRIRMLNAGRRGEVRPGLSLEEVRRSAYFAATFSSGSSASGPRIVERGDELIAHLPSLESASPARPAPEGSSADAEGNEVRLNIKSGLFVGLVRPSWGRLVLASPRRAPQIYVFPNRANSDGLRSIRASSGDLMIALSHGGELLMQDAAWGAALLDGAGAVLEFLEHRASPRLDGAPRLPGSSARQGATLHGAVVEIL